MNTSAKYMISNPGVSFDNFPTGLLDFIHYFQRFQISNVLRLQHALLTGVQRVVSADAGRTVAEETSN